MLDHDIPFLVSHFFLLRVGALLMRRRRLQVYRELSGCLGVGRVHHYGTYGSSNVMVRIFQTPCARAALPPPTFLHHMPISIANPAPPQRRHFSLFS